VTPAAGGRRETVNPKKYGYASLYSVGMDSYKHIENSVAGYLVSHYCRAVEIGIGRNTHAAECLSQAGVLLRSTDVKSQKIPPRLNFTLDDVFEPDLSLYQGADVIYSIRPAPEMVPPMIDIARAVNCDLIVCHLGFETYGNGGEKIDCGVMLHRYYRRSEPVKEG
jgi:uncharacterized protein